MKQRYHLENGEKFIEFPHDEKGLEEAMQYRKEHPEFKGKRIKEVIQAYPSIVYCFREYVRNERI